MYMAHNSGKDKLSLKKTGAQSLATVKCGDASIDRKIIVGATKAFVVV